MSGKGLSEEWRITKHRTMPSEKSMKDILLNELDEEVKKGSIKKKDAINIVDIFNDEMEEGYSDAEALYKCLYKIKSLKMEEN